MAAVLIAGLGVGANAASALPGDPEGTAPVVQSEQPQVGSPLEASETDAASASPVSGKMHSAIRVTSRTGANVSVTNKVVFRGKATQNLVGKPVQLQLWNGTTWVRIASSAVTGQKTFRVAIVVNKVGTKKFRLYVNSTAKTPAAKSSAYTYTVSPLMGQPDVAEVFGRITLSHKPEVTVAPSSLNLEVRTGDCKHVSDKTWTLQESPSDPGKYSIVFQNAGDYRLFFSTNKSVKYAPWGARGKLCAKAVSVHAVMGQRTPHSEALLANGAIGVTGKPGYYKLFDRTGKREINPWWSALPNGEARWATSTSYKIVRMSGKNQIISVFGTTSKDPAKGKTITVRPGKAIQVNYDTGTVSNVRTFSSATKVTISGNEVPGQALAGEKLTATLSTLPAGTKVAFQWTLQNEIDDDATDVPGATKSSFVVPNLEEVSGGWDMYLAVQVTITKPGYSPKTLMDRLTVVGSGSP